MTCATYIPITSNGHHINYDIRNNFWETVYALWILPSEIMLPAELASQSRTPFNLSRRKALLLIDTCREHLALIYCHLINHKGKGTLNPKLKSKRMHLDLDLWLLCCFLYSLQGLYKGMPMDRKRKSEIQLTM